MTTTQDLLRIGTSLQAAALFGENVKVVKKREIKTEDFINLGTKNILGTLFITEQSKIIGSL